MYIVHYDKNEDNEGGFIFFLYVEYLDEQFTTLCSIK